MSVGCIIRSYHLTDFLKPVIKNMAWVDKIVLGNYRFKSVRVSDDNTKDICEDMKLENLVLKQGDYVDEHEGLNLCMEEFGDKFEYVFIIDGDEILLRKDQETILNRLREEKKDAGLCTVIDFVKDLRHRAKIRTHKPLVIIKPNGRFYESRGANYGEGIVFNDINLYHLGYLVKDLDWKRCNYWDCPKKIDNIVYGEIEEYNPPKELLEILGVNNE